ncbi:MAG TPA: glycosyltransferase family 39 protein [Chitinophagaceae bacterium]|nr:glycosyltransferase family 39 protein [Chitinophagaceae bacterium]
MSTLTYKPHYFWIVLAIGAILLLMRLGATPIYILDEAKNAECAREMLQRHDVITPTFNGELRPDKPPLHYFFMIAAYKVWGTTPFAARFFSAIMGLLTVLVTYLYTKKFLAPFAAFCTVVVLLASPHFLFEFRLAVPDPYLIFFITLGLFSAFAWLEQNNKSQLYISAAALALATLAKGPVALALPGVCLLLWVIIARKWKTLFTWHILGALLVLAVITLPWYVAVDRATHGEWTKEFFIDNNLNRFSSPQEGHGGLFIITPIFVIAGLLPFTGFLGEVFKQRKSIFQQALTKFSGIVVLVFVIFFSLSSTRLPNYPMPCYPFAAIILGNFIVALLDGRVQSKKYPFFVAVVFASVVAVAGFFAIRSEAELRFLQWLPLLLLVCPAVLLLAYFTLPKKWPVIIAAIVAGYSLFNILGLQVIYPELYKQNPVTKTINMVKQHKYVVGYTLFNPAYRFYMDSNIIHTGDTSVLHRIIETHNDAIIITRAGYSDSLTKLPVKEIARDRDIFELPTTVIYSKADKH